MMRLASVLLVCVLLTTSVIGGTFAKYTTSVDSEDKARVAYWGFQSSNDMDITGLFSDTYGTTVDSVGEGDAADDVIAPGTSGMASFSFAWDEDTTAWDGAAVAVTGPEVAYDFTVKVENTCDALIDANLNIQWALVENEKENDTYKEVVIDDIAEDEWMRWDDMVKEIAELSGADAVVSEGTVTATKQYAPNTLPEAFTGNDDQYTIVWRWLFESDVNTYDHDNNAETAALTQDEYDTLMGNAQLLDDCSIKITITATQVD